MSGDEHPYTVITFEAPPGKHGDVIVNSYKEEYGVRFFPKVTRQICDGVQRFRFDSMCTYEAAPSGSYAVGYMDHLNRPLEVEFENPVCVVTMAIYPTGVREGEKFELTIEGWDEAGEPLDTAVVDFDWTKDTVRWRHMAGAYYLNEPASKIAISMTSHDDEEQGEVLRYLIDDLALVETGCTKALKDIAARARKSDGTLLNDGPYIPDGITTGSNQQQATEPDNGAILSTQ